MAIIANKLRLANCQGEIWDYLSSSLTTSFAFFLENFSINFTMLENPKPWENITSWEAKNRKPYFIIVNWSGVNARVVKLVFHTNARIFASITMNMMQMMKVIITLAMVKGWDIRDSRYSCAFLCLWICSLLVLNSKSRFSLSSSSTAINSSALAIVSSVT